MPNRIQTPNPVNAQDFKRIPFEQVQVKQASTKARKMAKQLTPDQQITYGKQPLTAPNKQPKGTVFGSNKK